MMKLWDVRTFANSTDQTHHEPYYAVRGHGGPIFAVTGTQKEDSSAPCSLIFTGGAEGIIKVWSPP